MSEDTTDKSSPLRLILVMVLMSFVVVGLMAGTQWVDQRSGQHGCEQKYGEDAEYIGDTSFFGGSAICEVDGEQKYAQPSMGWIASGGEQAS